MGNQDLSYKEFFSEAKNVEDLITGYVDKAFVSELDFSTLERCNADFVRKEAGERHDDMIWRLKYNNQWLYVYIILEFQSNVDYSMPVRIMSYMAELWLSLLNNSNTEYAKSHKIPPILPIVLYNGVEDWDAALNVADILQDKSVNGISVEYYLIDEIHPEKNKKNALEDGIFNSVTALIQIERTKGADNLTDVLKEIAKKLDTKEKLQNFKTLIRFIRRFLSTRFNQDVKEFYNMEEAIAMTYDFAEIERKKGEEKGEIKAFTQMIKKGFITLQQAAEQMNISVEKFQKLASEQGLL